MSESLPNGERKKERGNHAATDRWASQVSGWKADDTILHGVLLTQCAVNYRVAVRGENNHRLSQYLPVPRLLRLYLRRIRWR